MQLIRPVGDPTPPVFSQATRTAAIVARQQPRTNILRAPAVLAAATAFTGTVGNGGGTVAVYPKVPEPGFHPSSQPAMLILEGALFGIAVGGLYVFGRAIADLRRAS